MRMILAFLRGMREFRSCVTWADPARGTTADYTDLDHAYDVGRELAHKLTFRYWDN